MFNWITPWKWSTCKKLARRSRFSGKRFYFYLLFLPVFFVFMLFIDYSLTIAFPNTNDFISIFIGTIYLLFIALTFGYAILNLQFFYLFRWYNKKKDLRVYLIDCFRELNKILDEGSSGEELGDYRIAIVFLLDEILRKHVKTWGNIYSVRMISGYKNVLAEELPFILTFEDGEHKKKFAEFQLKLKDFAGLPAWYSFISYFHDSFDKFESKDNIMISNEDTLVRKIFRLMNEYNPAITILITVALWLIFFIFSFYLNVKIPSSPTIP